MQRKQALLQMEGSLSKLYKEWRHKIIKCLANVEAFIDFSEDENFITLVNSNYFAVLSITNNIT